MTPLEDQTTYWFFFQNVGGMTTTHTTLLKILNSASTFNVIFVGLPETKINSIHPAVPILVTRSFHDYLKAKVVQNFKTRRKFETNHQLGGIMTVLEHQLRLARNMVYRDPVLLIQWTVINTLKFQFVCSIYTCCRLHLGL